MFLMATVFIYPIQTKATTMLCSLVLEPIDNDPASPLSIQELKEEKLYSFHSNFTSNSIYFIFIFPIITYFSREEYTYFIIVCEGG
jgi:hypothetical protein